MLTLLRHSTSAGAGNSQPHMCLLCPGLGEPSASLLHHSLPVCTSKPASQLHHQPDVTGNGGARAALPSSGSSQARISAHKDRSLRPAFQQGRRVLEEGCRATEHTASFPTSGLAYFSLQCGRPSVGREIQP